MNYKPTEDEKNLAALTQMLAAVMLFVPGLVVGLMKAGKASPYVRYWAKVSMCWGICVVFLLGASVAVLVFLHTALVLLVVCVVHLFFSVMGALAAEAERPFHYLFVADAFCRNEQAILWFDAEMYAEQSDEPAEESSDEPEPKAR
jgi:hypothetical protein